MECGRDLSSAVVNQEFLYTWGNKVNLPTPTGKKKKQKQTEQTNRKTNKHNSFMSFFCDE